MQQLRIELSADRQWQWKVYSGNGENTATSETYTRKHDAERGFTDHAESILKLLADRGELNGMLERLGLVYIPDTTGNKDIDKDYTGLD